MKSDTAMDYLALGAAGKQEIIIAPVVACKQQHLGTTAQNKERACCIARFALQIDFWVWDNGRPVLNATVTRIVLVDAPCPDPSAPYLCFDSYAGRSLCSGVWLIGLPDLLLLL